MVNHSKEFKTADGHHTNNCEGIHGVLKRDARSQFGRLPYLTGEGKTFYLDLVVWRANARLKDEPLFYSFCKALHSWTNNPLEDFDHTIPVREEEEEEEVADEEDDVEEDWFVYHTDSDDSDDPDFVV